MSKRNGDGYVKADGQKTSDTEAGSKIRRMPPPWAAEERAPQPKKRTRAWREWLHGALTATRHAQPRLPRPPAPREALSTVRRWAWQHRYEILVVAAITGVGAFLRLYRLGTLPPGVLGDEAANALWAHNILDGEWAGAYDPFHARGRPAGFGFWLAGVIALCGDSLFSIRLASALLGILTIPLAYLLFRLVDGRATAAIGSSLLTLSSWHLKYSREAWEPILLVFAEVLAALFVVLALKSRKWWLFPVAGIALGLGVYSHNSYPFFLMGVAAVLVLWLATEFRSFTRAALNVVALAVAFLLTALPMLQFMRTHESVYFGRARDDTIFNSTRYEEASGFFGQADVILDTGRDFVQMIVFEGARDVPTLAVATSILLGLGVLYALRRWREPGIALAVILLFVVPWAAILNPGGPGVLVRRAVGVTPFIALLAALPLGWGLRSSLLLPRYLRALGAVAAVAAVASVGFTNMTFYFRDFAPNSQTNYAITLASRYLDQLPGEAYGYYYSRLWPLSHEVPRYLAPDVQAEERSGFWGSNFDLTPNRRGDVSYVFLDAFIEASQEVQELYPGGRILETTDDDGTILFRAYELPGAADVERELPTPTPAAGEAPDAEDEASALLRDLVRKQHLDLLRQALEQYALDEGEYPGTRHQIQPLCVYQRLDAGCSLTAFLPELPVDPSGPSPSSGYWYASDGASYVLAAQQEAQTEGERTCPDRVIHAARPGARYCVQGSLP